MAHSKHLSEEHKRKVAGRLGRLVARHFATADVQPQLAESFEIYLLTAEDIQRALRSNADLKKIIQPTGQWHHQIFVHNKPVGFARSTQPTAEGTDWAIHSFFRSNLAAKFEKAKQHIDKEHSEQDAEVKLIFAPAYHLYAFLLEHSRGTHVFVIDSPFSGIGSGAKFDTETEFLMRLQAVHSIRGLVPGKVSAIVITPQNVALTETKTVVFQAHDDQGTPLTVNWVISPAASGKIIPTGTPLASAAYTAPQQITESQAVTVTATAGGVTASTTVFLTPIVVQVVPVAVQLKHDQQQQFVATVVGDPTNAVTWIVSPGVGTITPSGLYTPDPSIVDCVSVKVTAMSILGHRTSSSAITLLPPPWTPWKRNLLGGYLLAVFLLVFLLVDLWPRSGPDPQLTNLRQAAQARVDTDTDNIKKAEDAVASGNNPTRDNVATPNPAVAALLQKKLTDDKALEEVREKEDASNDPLDRPGTSKVADRLGATLPRDIDLLFLVLTGGALGAFLHVVRSFTDFVGNEELKGSWAWWYYLHPFLGAILALAFYLAVRGGFLAVTNGNAIKTSEVSPFGLTSVAVFVGMFSKNAITKLSDVFETLFQPSTPKTLKNPLGTTNQSQGGIGFGPKVTSIAPSSGPTTGGTAVTITGTGFNDGVTANFAGVIALNTQRLGPTSIVVIAPPHSVGAVSVEVINVDNQKSSLPNAYQYV